LILIWSGDVVEVGTRIPGIGIGTGTGIGGGGGAWGVRRGVEARASVSGWSWLGLVWMVVGGCEVLGGLAVRHGLSEKVRGVRRGLGRVGVLLAPRVARSGV
jgi:hypothetical protein